MFRKPFKVKCQVQIKSNEKKKIVTDVKNYFPEINLQALVSYLGDKDDIVRMKIITFNKEVIDVWLIARVPMFFRMIDQNVTLPTVYMCWQFPQIVPRVTTNDYVMDKLKTGADLFSPGVYFDTKDMLKCILDVDDPISVNTVANAAPSAVGICTMEVARGLQSGRFARILHTVDDYLCRYHPMPQPSWGPVEMVSDDDTSETEVTKRGMVYIPEETLATYATAAGGSQKAARKNVAPKAAGTPAPLNNGSFPKLNEKPEIAALIAAAFAAGVSSSAKAAEDKGKAEAEAVPETAEESADAIDEECEGAVGGADLGAAVAADTRVVGDEVISKEDYDDLILYSFCKAVKEAPKTAFPILPANFFSSFMQPYAPNGMKLNMRKTKWKKLHVFLQDMAQTGIIKIETLRPNEYRILMANPKHIMLTDFHDVYETDTPAATAPPPDIPKPATLRANIPPIVFDIGQRASNKKVTIISNLHEYAVDIPRFAKTLQQAAAASCLITEPERKGKKGLQVQVQGNQILVAAKLISEMFGIGTTHMRGLEKGPKPPRK